MALKALWRRTTRVDRALVLALALLSGFSLWVVVDREPGGQVVIYRGEEVAYVGPLSHDRLLNIHGPLGDTRVEIEAGRVRVLRSPCPRKICISLGQVWKSGDLLACVPNRVVVRIEGEEGRGYDLLSR